MGRMYTGTDTPGTGTAIAVLQGFPSILPDVYSIEFTGTRYAYA